MAAELLTLERLNAADDAGVVALLDGIYERSPWVGERTAPRRPFATLAQLKRALVETVREASRDERLALLRAHPELAGKAMIARSLTAESTHEQGKAGLTQCTAEEFATLQRLNAATNEVLAQPEIVKRLLELGVTVTPGTPAQFTRFVQNQVATLQPVVKTVRVTL